MSIRIGVQLYTLREEMKKGGVPAVFEFCKGTGAQSVQISAMPEIPAEELAKISRDFELPITASHPPLERLVSDLDRVLDEHLIYGCKTVGVSTFPKEFDKTAEDGVKRFIDFINKAGEKAAARGLHMHYHNHDFEFKNIGGRKIIDMLYEGFSPDITFSLDVYWVKFAKEEPLKYMEKFGPRLEIVHMKDMKKTFGLFTKMAAPGQGSIDYIKIISEAERLGAKDAFIEVDISKDPKKTVTDGMKYIAESFLCKKK